MLLIRYVKNIFLETLFIIIKLDKCYKQFSAVLFGRQTKPLQVQLTSQQRQLHDSCTCCQGSHKNLHLPSLTAGYIFLDCMIPQCAMAQHLGSVSKPSTLTKFSEGVFRIQWKCTNQQGIFNRKSAKFQSLSF